MKNITDNPWEIALMLGAKAWGRTLVKSQLKSEKWWRNRQAVLLSAMPDVDLPNISSGKEVEIPIPFEQEMGWTPDTSQYWLGWLQTAFKKLNEHKKIRSNWNNNC